MSTDPTGTSGEDIGRPGNWGENRYQRPGQRTDESVRTPAGEVPNKSETPESTPVTREDYEGRKQ